MDAESAAGEKAPSAAETNVKTASIDAPKPRLQALQAFTIAFEDF